MSIRMMMITGGNDFQTKNEIPTNSDKDLAQKTDRSVKQVKSESAMRNGKSLLRNKWTS